MANTAFRRAAPTRSSAFRCTSVVSRVIIDNHSLTGPEGTPAPNQHFRAARVSGCDELGLESKLVLVTERFTLLAQERSR